MKNLNEEDLYKILYAEKEGYVIQHKELRNPDYNVWGRAKIWHLHQAACLFAGINPIEKADFEYIVDREGLSTYEFGKCNCVGVQPDETTYGFTEKETRLLKKIYQLLRKAIYLPADGLRLRVVRVDPLQLLIACKANPELNPLIPEQLRQVVETLGCHPSINLPYDFSVLEISASRLDELGKRQTLRALHPSSIPGQLVKKISPDDRNLFRCRPEQLARKIIR
ncbi:MAG: hypothetical protein HY861_03715 [Chlamydiia bacterium]|nr:hypothetical protein [Chlamydiia bacterium]